MKLFRRYLYRHLHHLVPLPILAAAFIGWLAEPATLAQFRLNVFDEYIRLRPRQYEPTPVRIIDIDDDSLQRFGQWPWPRTLLAQLVDRLNEMGAAVIASDLLFIDPDRTTPSRIIEHTKDIAPDDPLVARFKAMPDHDQVFADAIKRAHVVLGFALRNEEKGKLPRRKASYSNLGDDPRPWVPHFRGAAANLPELEAAATGNADPELVKDNIVLLGTTAEGLKEFRPTQLDPAEAGVEIHAQLIEQMLLGDIIKRPDWARGAEVIFMLYIGIGLLLLLPRVGARWTALLGLSAVTPAVCASWYAYYWYGLLIDPVFPSLVGVLVYLSSSAVLFFRTETERRQVRHAFSRYLAPAVVEHLAEHPERLTLGGELRELTIMFSDIRGFTTISEGLDARELTSFLNRYLTPMTDVIMSHDGTVDKYMADGIMAFWNAPLEDARHAEHACLAALAMRTELARLNDAWRAEAPAAGRPFREARPGIGLNSGECDVRNRGPDQRFDYSVPGDDANLASRLEGQTKTYHVDIILGERTALQVPQFAMLEIDLILVVGKTKPVRIFFLLGDESVRATSAFATLESAHDSMIHAYRRKDWETAHRELESCRSQAPEIVQYVYELYEQRNADLQATPPPPDWDGVYAALMK